MPPHLSVRHRIHASALLLGAGLLVGCNQAPTSSVTLTPSEPTTLQDLQATVQSNDLNGDPITLMYAWSVDGVVQDDLTGDTVPAARTARDEQWTVTVVANDGKEDGTSSSAGVTILNSAPTLSATLNPSRATTAQDLTIEVETDDSDADEVTVSYRWAVDGTEIDEGANTIEATALQQGQVWSVVVEASDGTATSDPVELSSTVGNAPPTILSVTFTPARLVADAQLAATVDAIDTDGDDITLAFQWERNGIMVSETSDRLPAGSLTRDDVIFLTVTPSDDSGPGEAFESEALVVLNSIPSVASVTLPDTVTEDASVTCSPTDWYDGDGDSDNYTYSWSVQGITIANTNDSLDGSWFDKGDTIMCIVTPDDGIDLGEPVSSNTTTVLNTPPMLTEAFVSPLPPSRSGPLTLILGSWSDPDPADQDLITFQYVWYVNSEEVSTDPSLDPSLFARGQSVYAVVTPSDPDGDGTSVQTSPVDVVNAPPVVDTLTVSPEVAYANLPIEASVSSSDADADPITHTFEWSVNGSVVQQSELPTLDASFFSRGDVIQVRVTPRDGLDDGETVQSSDILVINGPPSIGQVVLEPADVYEASVVDCVPQDIVDPDEDDVTNTTRWTVNDIEVSTESTLAGDLFDKGDLISCSLVPSDGQDDGELVSSTSVTVLNTPPIIEQVSIDQTTPREGDSLTVTITGLDDDDDADLDALELRYVWRADDTEIGFDPELTSADFQRGQVITVEVFASDPQAEGLGVMSSEIVVLNSTPVVTLVELTPSVAYTRSELVPQVEVTDADNDSITLTYDWLVDGDLVVEDDTLGTLDTSLFV
jgi:hypothetical protein